MTDEQIVRIVLNIGLADAQPHARPCWTNALASLDRMTRAPIKQLDHDRQELLTLEQALLHAQNLICLGADGNRWADELLRIQERALVIARMEETAR